MTQLVSGQPVWGDRMPQYPLSLPAGHRGNAAAALLDTGPQVPSLLRRLFTRRQQRNPLLKHLQSKSNQVGVASLSILQC